MGIHNQIVNPQGDMKRTPNRGDINKHERENRLFIIFVHPTPNAASSWSDRGPTQSETKD
jgi:hypothetical protein